MTMLSNTELESRVRKLLKRKDMQQASERAVAKEAECSRHVVRRVRIGLVNAGLIPPKPAHQGRVSSKKPIAYRGGYLLLPSGRVVREIEYLRAKARKKRKAAK